MHAGTIHRVHGHWDNLEERGMELLKECYWQVHVSGVLAGSATYPMDYLTAHYI